MNSKVLRAFLLTLVVGILAGGGFVIYRITNGSTWLEGAVAGGILFSILILFDIVLAVISIRERRRRAASEESHRAEKQSHGDD